jgi:NAD(P)-dependent dehydrogenase (short-subunit alcohol dehydrogenase family)
VIRRDLLKSLGLVAAGNLGGAAATQAGAREAQREGEQLSLALENYATSWDPQDPEVPGRQNIARVPEDYFMPGRFAGKTVIVTGCARGMGEVAARRLAREGANVVGLDILEERGADTIASIVEEGLSATFVHGDVSRDAVCAEMVRVAVDGYGGLDAALNNAGVVDALVPDEPIDYAGQRERLLAPIHEAGDPYWHRVMEVNVTGVFYSMRHELRQMLAQRRGGAIVNVASVAGLRGFGSTPSYVASKHAVQGLTRNAAIDYAPYGIRVNSVGMAVTRTPMLDRSIETLAQRRATGYKDTGIGLYKSMSLLQYSDQERQGSTAAEQVAVMLFLLSPEASNLTGATYQTDGGYVSF